LDLAKRNGYAGKLQDAGEKLLARVAQFFAGYAPASSLLHGDLWSGNAAQDGAGAPVLFDPAVYYGDREADIAMTELFGGFSSSFYAAYRSTFPLDSGYTVRKNLYNLYHVLNHLNLFGGGYLRQAERMIDALLAA
ncbi:MAG TPA: fructosamine kinase family protein, partial [Burkholderiales bacterium]|nr:fructosamine kinase family protein [Burkholderiales bacterium]